MITLEEYKTLLGDELKDLTEEEIELWYKTHTTFVSLLIKVWLRSRRKEE